MYLSWQKLASGPPGGRGKLSSEITGQQRGRSVPPWGCGGHWGPPRNSLAQPRQGWEERRAGLRREGASSRVSGRSACESRFGGRTGGLVGDRGGGMGKNMKGVSPQSLVLLTSPPLPWSFPCPKKKPGDFPGGPVATSRLPAHNAGGMGSIPGQRIRSHMLQLRYHSQFTSVAQSCLTICDPMDTRLPYPSPTPGACSNSCPSSQWCHPTNLSSVIPFSSCLQSFPASGSFLMTQFFTSGGQSIGASASVLPMNSQDWFPLGWTGWISLQSKGLSRVFSNTTVQKHQFFGAQLSSWSKSHIHIYCN